MPMVEDVKKVLLGVIVLVVGVAVFSRVFATPDLDQMANVTAQQLASAISEAAYYPVLDHEPNIKEDAGKYVAVPVRLGQPGGDIAISMFQLTTGVMPRYQLFYENFPEGGLGWDESYPWSGGSVAYTIGFVVFMKVLPKGLSKMSKSMTAPGRLTYRIGAAIVRFPARIWNGVRWVSNRIKNRLWVWSKTLKITANSLKKGRFVNAKAILQASMKSISPRKAFKIERDLMVNGFEFGKVAQLQGRRNLQEVLDVVKIDRIYDNAGNIVPGKLSRNKIKFINAWIDISFGPAEASKMRSALKIPRFGWLKTSVKYSNGVKWVKGSRIFKFGQRVNKFVSEYRVGFRKWRSDKLAGRKALPVDETKQIWKDFSSQCRRHPASCFEDVRAITGKNIKDEADVLMKLDAFERTLKQNDFIMYGTPESIMGVNQKMSKMALDNPEYFVKGSNKATWDAFKKSIDGEDAIFQTKLVLLRTGMTDAEAQKAAENMVKRSWQGMKAAARKVKAYDSNALLKKFGSIQKQANRNYFRSIRANPTEASRMANIFAGKRELRPALRWIADATQSRAAKRAVRFAFIDVGRYENGLWYGPAVMQNAEEGITSDMSEPDTNNALIFVKEGANPVALPLDPKVQEVGGVKVWRPKPARAPVPIFIQQLMLWFSVPQNPRYYTVSPCMGTAKVWRGTDAVYVAIDKCAYDQSGTACQSYCYADETRIFGTEGAHEEINGVVWGTFWGTFGGCLAATCAAGGACQPQLCVRVAGGVEMTTVLSYSSAKAATENCLEQNWGYWDYYAAADACDFGFMMATWGAGGGGKAAATTAGKQAARGAGQEAAKETAKEGAKETAKETTKEAGKEAGKKTSLALRAKNYAKTQLPTDICMVPYIVGDAVMSWSSVGFVKHGLEAKQIRDREAACTWGTCNFNGQEDYPPETWKNCCTDVTGCPAGKCDTESGWCQAG